MKMLRSMPFWLISFGIVSVLSAAQFEFELDGVDGESGLPSALRKTVGEAYESNIKGLEALDAGDYDRALALFDQALKTIPEYSDAENNRGVVYFRRGNLARAREIWSGLVNDDKTYAIGRYNLALADFHEGDYLSAVDHLKKSLDINSRMVESHVLLGKCRLRLGNHNEALTHFKKAHRIDSNHEEAWGMLAFGLIQTGDTLEALNVLRRHKENREALKMLGRIAAVRGQNAKAEEYLTMAVVQGASSEILIELSTIQLNAGLCTDALGTIESYFERTSAPSADAWLLGGLAEKECGNLRNALLRFESGLKRFPSDPILRYNLGRMYFHEKEFSRAEAVWSSLADTVQDPFLYHSRALAAQSRGKMEDAERYIEKALSMDERAEYYDFRGIIRHKRGDRKGAVADFRKALRLDPGLRSAQLNLAVTNHSPEALEASIESARGEFDSCIEDCAESALQLSILYFHRRDIDEAVNALTSLGNEEMNENVLRHLAIYYRENREWDSAVSVLERAVERFVVEPRTEYELALMYLRAGYYRKAAQALKDVVVRRPEEPWRIYYQIGYCYMELDNTENAITYFEKSLQLKPGNPAARGLLAFVHNRIGNTEEAGALWRENLNDDPDNPTLWINMGLLMEQKGNYEQALANYEKAAMLRPEDKAIQINIGNAYSALSKDMNAKTAYSLALDSPKRDIAAYNSFLLGHRTGDKEHSKRMLRILSEEFPTSIYTSRARGETAAIEGDTAQAIQILENLPERNEHDLYTLAELYLGLGNTAKAGNALRELPETPEWEKKKARLNAAVAFKNGEYGEAYRVWKAMDDTAFAVRYNMALSLAEAGDHEAAMSLGEELVSDSRGDDRKELCRLIGNAAFRLSKWDKARIWYSQLSGLEPRNAIVQYNLAVAFYKTGKVKAGWEHYQKARELDSSLHNEELEKLHSSGGSQSSGAGAAETTYLNELDVMYNNAVTFQSEGKGDSAIVLYNAILQRDSRYTRAWNNLGAIHAAAGELDRAEECYRKSVERRHDLVEGYANLTSIFMAKGEPDKARYWVMKGLGHNPDDSLLTGMKEQVEHVLDSLRFEKSSSKR